MAVRGARRAIGRGLRERRHPSPHEQSHRNDRPMKKVPHDTVSMLREEHIVVNGRRAKVIGKKKGTGEERDHAGRLGNLDEKESFSKGVDSSTKKLDPDLDASCDGLTPCESELGYAAHAKTKCADSV